MFKIQPFNIIFFYFEILKYGTYRLKKGITYITVIIPIFRYNWSKNDFELGAPLGKGKFGRVYVAREKKTKFMVAMKVMFKSELISGRVEKQVLREIEIQSRLKWVIRTFSAVHLHSLPKHMLFYDESLMYIDYPSRHPNILRLFTWFHDEKRIYLALEIASEGELYKHLQRAKHSRFPEDRAARYTYQVADALNYCHVNNVIHRDLKPENLMLTHDDKIKLADFGWSAHTRSNKRKTMCGTLDYLPPEM